MKRILVIDNYDSFVFNLVQYVAQLGADPVVVRNDVVTPDQAGAQELLAQYEPDGVLISPGPGTPESAGVSIGMVGACTSAALPLFGVCLGHQAIAAAAGATVGHAPELLHGKTSQVHHDGSGVLAGLSDPFTATRYHSLAVEASSVPAELIVNASTESGVVMGLRHASLPIQGVQFHPESVLTQGGHRIVANWLAEVGQPSALALADDLDVALDDVRANAKFSLL